MQILYEKVIILERKQCLKSEVKNQQAVIEMLITRKNCGSEWKSAKIINSRQIPTNCLC